MGRRSVDGPARVVALGSLLAVTVLALALSCPAMAQSPTPVVRSQADEDHVTAGWNRAGTVQYVAFNRRDPVSGRTNAYLRRVGAGRPAQITLNRSGEGDVGGFFYGRRVLYSQRLGVSSLDLWIYDIFTGRRWPIRSVNTSRNESLASRSGNFLLFNRDDRFAGKTRVVLQDIRGGPSSTTVLAVSDPDSYVYAGQVNGNWAVWTVCELVCDVYKRDIAAGLTTIMPKAASTPEFNQYDASVSRDGTVYLVRSDGDGCNSSAIEIMRFGSLDPPEGALVARLQAQRFTTLTYAREHPAGDVDLFFARGACSNLRHDAFKISDVGL